MRKNQWIGIIAAVLMVLSTAMVVSMPEAQAEDLNNPIIQGFVGITTNVNVTVTEGQSTYLKAGSITVQLFKTFDLYNTEPYMTTPTASGGYFHFEVPPGSYTLGIESKESDGTFYYRDGTILVEELGYNDINASAHIAIAEATVESHFHGIIADDDGPVTGATVTFHKENFGFTASDITDNDGIYDVDVFADTFDMSVEIDGTVRYYGAATATVKASDNVVMTLNETPYNGDVTVKVNGAAHDDADVALAGQTLTVSELKNNDKVEVNYYWQKPTNESKNTYVNIDPAKFTLSPSPVDGSITNVGYKNITAWYTLNGDYSYDPTTKKLDVTTVINGTLYAAYSYLEQDIAGARYAGRNVNDVTLSEILLGGRVMDDDTSSYIMEANIYAVMYDGTHIYTSVSPGPSFSIMVPKENPAKDYTLIVYPEGYAPSTTTQNVGTTNIDIDDLVFTSLEDQSSLETHIFSRDETWDHITITKTMALNAYDSFPGMDMDFKNVRFQLDENKDGTLNQTELDDFTADLVAKGPEFLSTSGFFYFNDTDYNSVTGSYGVTINVPGLDATHPVPVNATTPITAVFTMNYNANDLIAEDEEEYPAELLFDTDTGVYRLTLLENYS
ncbi:MAG: hypothetical protein KAT70_05355, partial [Thermoplasmata archaeon]|nr:hypothetical protein [Thermoplasmata archaeon]